MRNSVCSVIVTYKIGRDFSKCFKSIQNQVEEVIVVDNGGDKETIFVLNTFEKTYDNLKVFYNGENLGIAAALNIGVEYAIEKGYTWILTLDHDSEAIPHMVEKLLITYETLSNKGVGEIGIMAANSVDKNINGKQLFDTSGEVKEVEKTISSGSLIKSCVFEKVGFFNESLFMYYVDDDFCLRCRNNNWRIFVCCSAMLLHKEGDKEARRFLWKHCIYDNYDYCAMYYILRNTVYMLSNYYRYRKYCYYTIRRVCIDTIKIVLFGKDRIRLIYFMTKGLLDGIRGRYGKLVIRG